MSSQRNAICCRSSELTCCLTLLSPIHSTRSIVTDFFEIVSSGCMPSRFTVCRIGGLCRWRDGQRSAICLAGRMAGEGTQRRCGPSCRRPCRRRHAGTTARCVLRPPSRCDHIRRKSDGPGAGAMPAVIRADVGMTGALQRGKAFAGMTSVIATRNPFSMLAGDG